ncbi:MAG: bifunctional diaminohydroxyphosphoribosylaminopyrimidine deaminase/5-amino-6-(5-phosphoribosylamino)uracil reductase RibD [Planctomycetota bacterium]|nr:bifunctional diaminohydroxyphosphoribosylaminopyrimidine deaminase/5-amino-6-(5-phosphoribosylamino)uracil reductase RibD [Planctomycetota bacterium]
MASLSAHEVYMEEALRLAARGRGRTSPNPMVGAVIVKNGRVVGRGWHERFGGPHAEANALEAAGWRARGASLYVTLEPCAHYGKTPPCTEAIIRAGVRRVILGTRDPNRKAAGGAAILRRAGIEVIEGVLEESCRRLNAPFFKYIRTGMPLVTVKWAMTLDGKIAAPGGDARWVTCDEARQRAQMLRAEHDAVCVGIGTVLADRPRLNCRYRGAAWQPRRIVLDSLARTPLDSPILSSPGGEVMIAVTSAAPLRRVRALEKAGATVLRIAKGSDSRVNLEKLLKRLPDMGILSVMIEGGAEVLGSAFDAGVADRVAVFVGARVLGGRKALSAVGGVGARRMAFAEGAKIVRVEKVGEDLMIEAEPGDWSWFRPVCG